MTVLLREAMKPNLVQTIEGGPAFIHTGPFANIAHGNSSVAADRIALKLVDAVVTESGFGSDMGFQKFVDIKCRLSGLRPAAAVIVATMRALKMHGGVGHVVAGKPLDPALAAENPEGVARGCANLVQHIEIVRGYGIPAVVAINSFPGDRESEVGVVRDAALAAGAQAAVVSDHFARGGEGAAELAHAVWAAASEAPAAEDGHGFRFLSRDEATLEERITRIATRVYGAAGVDFLGEAAKQLHEFERLGYGHLPVCMAKTQLSLSHDPELKGRPTGYRVPIRDARLFAGAGFVTVYCGDMLMMPGLPSRPSGENVDIDANGETVGLF
jgi:formyltetrahydrofolate synthetase